MNLANKSVLKWGRDNGNINRSLAGYANTYNKFIEASNLAQEQTGWLSRGEFGSELVTAVEEVVSKHGCSSDDAGLAPSAVIARIRQKAYDASDTRL